MNHRLSSTPYRPCRRLFAAAGLYALLVLAASPVTAQDTKTACDVSAVKAELESPSPGLLATFFSSDWGGTTRCSSLKSVMKLASNTTKKGGRKLEPDKPLDVKAAEQERAAANANPAFAKLLATELKDEADAARRLLREAALLHDEGHYKARDLLLVQLRSEKAK
jgi:hypothetical protein